ncbi:MAG: zinc-binding dehydrogenase [Clostridia bacterium]|nr:zinc-binding dehydrogenase [Clostridia bacterium]
MKAAYLKAPRQFEVREIELREIHEDEVIVDVRACGYCGHDNILASYHAKEWEPFGHEFAGVVSKVGGRVRGLVPGDKVCIETNMFDPLSDCARNGRPDLDTLPLGSSFMDLDKGHRGGMGFAEQVIVPGDLCVKFDGLSFEEACMIEPLGVAYDIVKTADIRLNDGVLVFGCGPIGLMAMKLAKASGARRIYAAQHAASAARCELAARYGADEMIFTDRQSLGDYAFEKGGVDRVLMTVPPKFMGEALGVMNAGGILSFAGISYNEPMVTFDSNKVHLDKLQIRGSNAIPALYFPMCIEMVKAGIVELKPLISHRMRLETLPEDLARYYSERDKAVKAVMVRD